MPKVGYALSVILPYYNRVSLNLLVTKSLAISKEPYLPSVLLVTPLD